MNTKELALKAQVCTDRELRQNQRITLCNTLQQSSERRMQSNG
jgi:hypothetical protein